MKREEGTRFLSGRNEGICRTFGWYDANRQLPQVQFLSQFKALRIAGKEGFFRPGLHAGGGRPPARQDEGGRLRGHRMSRSPLQS